MQAQADPRLNSVLLAAMHDTLFKKPCEALAKQLIQITERNSRLCGNTQACFIYRGETYGAGRYFKAKVPLPRPMNMLHLSLAEEMNTWLEARWALETKEMPYVMGYLQRVCTIARTLQDYLNLIPETLHSPLHEHAIHFPQVEDLPEARVSAFLTENQKYLQMVKERMVYNLLL